MADKPQTHARKAAIAFLQQARLAGWTSASVHISPDGSVQIDTSMTEGRGDDDFDTSNLKM